jgi:putative aminopeptidase FrvX
MSAAAPIAAPVSIGDADISTARERKGMTVGADSVALLKTLSESFGPSGYERETASIVKEAGEKYSDEVSFDKLGSVIFKKRGTSDSPRILLAGHMDEVGFVISGIEKESGYLTFSPLGGWFDQVLLGQSDGEDEKGRHDGRHRVQAATSPERRREGQGSQARFDVHRHRCRQQGSG